MPDIVPFLVLHWLQWNFKEHTVEMEEKKPAYLDKATLVPPYVMSWEEFKKNPGD